MGSSVVRWVVAGGTRQSDATTLQLEQFRIHFTDRRELCGYAVQSQMVYFFRFSVQSLKLSKNQNVCVVRTPYPLLPIGFGYSSRCARVHTTNSLLPTPVCLHERPVVSKQPETSQASANKLRALIAAPVDAIVIVLSMSC